jgi:hypothetical protein
MNHSHISPQLLKIIKQWLIPSLRLNLRKDLDAEEYLSLLKHLKKNCSEYIGHSDVRTTERLREQVADIIEVADIHIELGDIRNHYGEDVMKTMSLAEAEPVLGKLGDLRKRSQVIQTKNEPIYEFFENCARTIGCKDLFETLDILDSP